MQKHLLYIPLVALSSALALTACSDEVTDTLTPDVPVGEKSPIELSVGGVDSPGLATRAVITDGTNKDGTNKTLQGFDENTSLYMLMKSENVDDTSKPALVTRTIMFALPKAGSDTYSQTNYSESNQYNDFVRFWDDSYARSSALSILAVCTPGMGPGGSNTKTWKIGNDAAYVKVGWTRVSGSVDYPSVGWPIGNDTQISAYKFLTDQSLPFDGVSFIKNQDLCFSNNIGDWSDDGGSDKRLKFNSETKKFPREEDKWTDGSYKTRMIFYHALSKLTFCIKMGDGFTDAEFKFNTDTNIKLSNFLNKGTFNIEAGEFVSSGTGTPTTGTIERIYQHPSLTDDERTAELKYILDALVIPGTDMSSSDNAVTFYINNNEYKLTKEQLYAAFTPEQKSGYFDSNKLKAGVRYVFTFTVGKTQIKNITASIADWETVTADNLYPSNARIKLQLEERNNADGTNVFGSGDAFSIYRAADDIPDAQAIKDDYAAYNWAKQYTSGYATFVAAAASNPAHWRTDWYWDSNKNFYHFRALCEVTSSGRKEVATTLLNDATKGGYLSLSHCEKTSTASYHDILWGAPMLDKADNSDNDYTTLKWHYGPTTRGFDAKDDGTVATGLPTGTKHQIYKAIGPTEDQIKLVLFHMMSDVQFKVKSTTDPAAAAVDLGDGTAGNATTIELQKIHTSGKLYMGNGLVLGSTDNVSASNYTFTQTPAPDGGVITWSDYGAIPQSLENVVLVITTADKNQYKVAMKDVVATTVATQNLANPYSALTSGDNSGKYPIDRWYPGFKYIYTFTLSKTGITDLQATIVDWETVTADEQEVVIQ